MLGDMLLWGTVQNEHKRPHPNVRMTSMEGDLMRRQIDLAAFLHHLELDRDDLPRLLERNETVRDAKIYPRLNPGNKAVWEVFLYSVIQARLGLPRHPLPPRVRRALTGSAPQGSARPAAALRR